MPDKTISIITSQFEDVKILMNELKAIKKQERRVKRKLISKSQLYLFLETIVGKTKKDKELVEPLFKFFKHLKLNINRSPDKDKEGIEDLRLFYDNKLLIIEASSTKKLNPTESKTHQISKHIKIRQSQFPDFKVTGLTIINHLDEIDFTHRNKNVFTKRQIDIAKENDYTLISTLTLLEEFIKIRNNRLSIQDFINALSTSGLYKMSGESPNQ